MNRSKSYRRLQGSNQFQTKERYYGLKLNTWRDILIILWVAALLAALCMNVKAEAYDDLQGAFISPIPYLAHTLDENGLPVLTASEQSDWNAFIAAAHKLAPLYDYPVKVIIAQGALETGRGTSRMARERNNYFGYMCYDRDPEKYCATFENMEQSIIRYMLLIQSKYPDAYEARNNPERMIELIKAGGYASDDNYVAKIRSLPEWRAAK